MKVHALRNAEGEYISMSGERTLDWFQASKFPATDIERRTKFLADEFKVVTFEVNEIENEGKDEI